MKTPIHILSVLFILTVFLLLPSGIKANWISNEKPEVKGHETVTTHETENKEPLPEGVTDDWLNSLEDEKGNKIISDKPNLPNEDPEGDALQRTIFTGFTTSDNYGYSVSSAGDVNGDGYSDIIVGARNNDGGGSNAGRAYIYFGGLIMNNTVDVTLTGEAANDYFGFSVSSAGDVNGDGYSDVIIGAYWNDAGGTNAGKAYVYFGGPAMNNVADVIMTGEATNNYYGYSVSSAGDVNGDGYSDVIIGAVNADISGSGRTYVYFGGPSMNNIADVIMTGEAAGDSFGYSVSSADDVNGDGYGDVIVGAFTNDAGGTNAGRAYTYFGGVAMNNTADIIMTGEAAGDNYGRSVSSAGDVNGDGFGDVIVGANANDAGGSNAGRAYIYFGSTSMDNSADVILTGEAADDQFGSTVSSAGDVNGDGYSDVIAGAVFNDAGGNNSGRAYVYFGGSVMNNIADIKMTGEAADDQFGFSVSSAGDVNGDGYPDIIVGAPYNDAGGFAAGRAYVYDYFMKNDIIHDISMTGEAAGNNFGYSVSSAGDVNGDGYSDIIVGMRNSDTTNGKVYIYFGGTSMDKIPDVIMEGEATGDWFGSSVSSAGDMNGDGYSDVIVGAPYNHGGGYYLGRVYVYLGGISMNNTADIIMTGVDSTDELGISVSSAGDVNGDGFGDVIVGVINAYPNGKALIYYGGTILNNVEDIILSDHNDNDLFGYRVSSAGDVNGDGFGDVIVADPYYDDDSLDVGRAYVYFGGVTMNNTADAVLKGEGEYNYFGLSVSSAGDVNGDGYSDVIAGAYLNDGGGYLSGRAYIYFGGVTMDNTADVIFTPTATNNLFGFSVSSAGDVNADGYGDVIIGAYSNDAGGLNAGQVYIFFGGAVMNNIADITMTGNSLNGEFGSSVSYGGDVNGDGYSDLIVGENHNDEAGIHAGKAYLFYGSAISVKPILNYVKDVPNDQGGFVDLKWARSGYDVNGNNMITHYIVERSNPPSGGSFSWEQIANIPSNKNSFYTYTAGTNYDSSSISAGNFFFRITARTSNPSDYWRSGILFGRSIDNLAPLMVSPFTAAGVASDVSLNWERSSAPDLLNYLIYRNVNPAIDPETEPAFATTADSTYLDTAPLAGNYYYFIVAQDIHNNKSPVAVAASPESNMTLNLTMFIEGFYNSGIDLQVSDTITVELRNASSPFAVVDQSEGVFATDGAAQFTFNSAPDGNYYFNVRHRNSIETWSATPQTFSLSSPLNYLLSSASSQAYGSNQKQIDASPLRYAIFSGDENQNGLVDLTDVVNVSNAASSFTNGYVPTDMNGDNITDLSDLVITSNNASAFVARIIP